MQSSALPLSKARHTHALIWLVSLHIVIIAASNYLVQLPFEVFGFVTTWGAFTFPVIFLITDLTVRIFGRQLARKIIFFAMMPALLVSYYFSVVFFEGNFVGHGGLFTFNLFVFRVVVASFAAYVIGQLLDITIFARLRKLKTWWVAPLASTFFGNLVDSLVFFTVAFYQSSDPFMAEHWLEIGLVDYAFKMIIGICLFLPLYGVILGKIQGYLTKSA